MRSRQSHYFKGVSSAAVAVVLILVVIGVLVFVAPGIFQGGAGGGLTFGGVGPGTQGVIIKSFTSELTSLIQDKNSPIDLTYLITVENVGESNTANVKAEIVSGLGKGKTASGINGISMLGIDTTSNKPGEAVIGTFDNVRPPESKSTDQTYPSTALLTYSYTTSATFILKAVNTEYLKVKAGEQGGIIGQKYTKGPFSVSVTTRNALVPSGNGKIRLQIDIQNIGGGIVYMSSLTDGKIKISVSPTTDSSATIVSSDQCSSSLKEVPLLQGKSRTIFCDVTLSNVQSFENVPMEIKLEYNYYVDSTTQIKVLKGVGTESSEKVQTTQCDQTATITLVLDKTSVKTGGNVKAGITTPTACNNLVPKLEQKVGAQSAILSGTAISNGHAEINFAAPSANPSSSVVYTYMAFVDKNSNGAIDSNEPKSAPVALTVTP